MTSRYVINASVSPKGSLETLSQREVQQLSEAGCGSTYTLFRQCALAILNTGARIDNAVRFGTMVASVTIMKSGSGEASAEEVLAVADSLAPN